MEGRMWELAIPLMSPFVNAAVRIEERRTVLVEVRDGVVAGWGEAAPFPGITPDTVGDAWSSLERGSVLSPTAAAALDEALADLDAHRREEPLWRAIGGSGRPVPTAVAVGLDEDPIERIESTGADGAKLKIRPGDDVDRVAAVVDAHPDIPIGVDANGSYRWSDRDALLSLDGIGVAYIEQPFATDDLESHAQLRAEVVAPVVLDETIDSRDAAIRAIEAGACDIVGVKPGRLGISNARVIHDIALAAGLRIKASGLVETGVGRAHARAIASLPGAVYSDIAEASWFLEGSVGEGPAAEATEQPGIGFVPDPEQFASYVVREAALGSRIWD